MQGENESTAQYLTRAKVLLEHIHHNSKMCDIPGISYDKLYFVRGLHSPHARQRVASEQETWCPMEDVFQTIGHVTRSKERYRAFFNPNLETMKPVMQVNEVSYGKAIWHHKSDGSNNGKPCPLQFNNNFRENTRHQWGLFRRSPGQQAHEHCPKKIVLLL